MLLHDTGASNLWYQPHLGGEHDETQGHRLPHAGVPQVRTSSKPPIVDMIKPQNNRHNDIHFVLSSTGTTLITVRT